jgi:hypothetical protein
MRLGAPAQDEFRSSNEPIALTAIGARIESGDNEGD